MTCFAKTGVRFGWMVGLMVCGAGMGCWFAPSGGGQLHAAPKTVKRTEQTQLTITFTRLPKTKQVTSKSFTNAVVHWRFDREEFQTSQMELAADSAESCTYTATIPAAGEGKVNLEYYFTYLFDGHPNGGQGNSHVVPVVD